MRKRITIAVYAASIAFVLLSGKSSLSQEITVTNVSYSMKDSNVVVHYDLAGPTDKSYKIQLSLRRGSQPFFRMLPKTVAGDVGTGTYAGADRQIVWQLYEDMPYGLDGDDYYFEVNATLLGVEKGGASWLYYVGGALVAGGAAVYFGTDVFKKSGGGSQFPAPPLRP